MNIGICQQHKKDNNRICLNVNCKNSYRLICEECLKQHQQCQDVITQQQLLTQLQKQDKLAHINIMNSKILTLQNKIQYLYKFCNYLAENYTILAQYQQQIKQQLKQINQIEYFVEETSFKILTTSNQQHFNQYLMQFKANLTLNNNRELAFSTKNIKPIQYSINQTLDNSKLIINDIKNFTIKIIEVMLSQEQIQEYISTQKTIISIEEHFQKKICNVDNLIKSKAYKSNILQESSVMVYKRDQIGLKNVQSQILGSFEQQKQQSSQQKSNQSQTDIKTYYDNKLNEMLEKYLNISQEKQKIFNQLSVKQNIIFKLQTSLAQIIKKLQRARELQQVIEDIKIQSIDIKRSTINMKEQIKQLIFNQLQQYTTSEKQYYQNIITIICDVMDCTPDEVYSNIEQLIYLSKKNDEKITRMQFELDATTQQVVRKNWRLNIIQQQNQQMKQQILTLQRQILIQKQTNIHIKQIKQQLQEKLINQQIKITKLNEDILQVIQQKQFYQKNQKKYQRTILNYQELIQISSQKIKILTHIQNNTKSIGQQKHKIEQIYHVAQQQNQIKQNLIQKLLAQIKQKQLLLKINQQATKQQKQKQSSKPQQNNYSFLKFNTSIQKQYFQRQIISNIQMKKELITMKIQLKDRQKIIQQKYKQINIIKDKLIEKQQEIKRINLEKNQIYQMAQKYQSLLVNFQQKIKTLASCNHQLQLEKISIQTKNANNQQLITMFKEQINSYQSSKKPRIPPILTKNYQFNNSRPATSSGYLHIETQRPYYRTGSISKQSQQNIYIDQRNSSNQINSEENQDYTVYNKSIKKTEYLYRKKYQKNYNERRQQSKDTNKNKQYMGRRKYTSIAKQITILQRKVQQSEALQSVYKKQLQKKRSQNKKLKIQLASNKKNQMIEETKNILQKLRIKQQHYQQI